jgi:ATP-dependent Lon protease
MVEMKNKKIFKKDLKKIEKKKKKSSSKSSCLKKTRYYQNIIQDSILYVQKYKLLDIIDAGELNICIQNLEKLFDETNNILILLNNKKQLIDFEEVVRKLQKINNDLSSNFRLYGTKNINYILDVCFGSDYINENINDTNNELFDVIKKYIHPIHYKVLDWRTDKTEKNEKIKKKLAKNRIIEDFMLVDTAQTLDCFDLARTTKKFQTKIYGIKVVFQDPIKKRTMIVSAVTDDMIINCMNLTYLRDKLKVIKLKKPEDIIFMTEDFDRFTKSLTLKELLVYSNTELYQRYVGYVNQTNLIKKKTISQIVKEFISNDLFGQRKTLIQLLMKYGDPEFQYLAYLLYDLLSNDVNGSFDTVEQTILFDSLPWNIKKYFRDAMKTTITYTKNLSNFDINKIPIEQQICLLKADDSVKEKAMLKLKEVKAKSEDSGSKARQYLDGLLKIPFGIYKKEAILRIMDEIKNEFKTLIKTLNDKDKSISKEIIIKDSYSNIEIIKHLNYLRNNYIEKSTLNSINNLKELFLNGRRDNLVAKICFINSIVKKHNLKHLKILHSGKKNAYMRENIEIFFDCLIQYPVLLEECSNKYPDFFPLDKNINLENSIENIFKKWEVIIDSIKNVKKVLNESIYGHNRAKRQIERVIGQWITGKQTGYCFGFEGPPGVGKTSLARKGLAKCLKDKDGVTRPFSFIALGGSSNGSTLSGHNYTYVGSTWGRIVDILMENKCMNPIIFIDELDKVSKTENGKEIIGILTHLIDSTQNESFQDKYFSGIDLDMSKALFIFSYNDVSCIDKILLDRIHRIKFDHLTLHDKLEITNKYILPELYDKVGLKDSIYFSDDIITYIIENYTSESGVRKLKEILYEIISEINLEILNQDKNYELPIKIKLDDIKNIYLKDRNEIIHKKIHTQSTTGIINGLWANSIGMGGIIPIECFYWPSNNFMDLKLTGLQGDVMKESMNVAKTLAWKLTDKKNQNKLSKIFEKTKLQGIHIHCPEGAVPKDGPSAGTAITTAIFSLLNNKIIKKDVAITGEINLQGKVSAIGGLPLKILGGIKAGVKTFIYPDENKKDYNKFMKKYESKKVIPNDVTFISVKNIKEVLKIVFE